MSLAVRVRKALGAFRLEVAFETSGHVTALFGRSGAGKSSLVNIVAGLLRPDQGSVSIDGAVLVDTAHGIFIPAHRRRIGYVFQEARLFPHLSVRGNLLYGRRSTRPDERWGSLEQVTELLGIGHLLGRRPAGLSGGEKQRVAIGRALLASPRLLLMDEPLAGVDRERKAEILPYIARLRSEMKLPILYVSHAVEEIAAIADTVVVIEAGRVAANGPVAAVLPDLDSLSLGDAFEAGVILTAAIVEHDAAAAQTVLNHPAGRLMVPGLVGRIGAAMRIRVRARDVAIAVGEPGRLSIRNRLSATVIAIRETQPPAVEVRLDAGGDPILARVTRDAVRDLGLAVGMTVTALVKSVAVEAVEPPSAAS